MSEKPIPGAAWNKAWVYGHSLAGIEGSNPAGGMDVCLLWVLSVVTWRVLQWTDHSFKGVLPSVVCLRRGLQKATVHASRQRVQLPASGRAESKLDAYYT